MTIETKDAKAMRDNFRFASLRIKTKKVNGRVYWYGENEVDGLYLKHNPKTSLWARTSKKAAVEILNKYGITAEQFIAYEKGELEIVEVNDEYKPQCDWENPHNYEATGANHARNLYTTETESATENETATCNGYIFTAYSTRTGFDSNGYTNDVESIEIKCDTLGNADTFDGLYREVVFFDANHKDSWDIKTTDGKILAKGNTEDELRKAYDNLAKAEVTTATDANEEIINCNEIKAATTDVTNAPEVARFQTGKTYRYFDENSGKPLWYITIDKRTNTTVTVSGEKFKVFIQNHDRMLNYDKPTESFIRGNYRIDAADACEETPEEITPTTLQKFIEAKKEVSYWRNSTGARIWQIAYIRYGVNGGIVGQTPWLNRTMKEANSYLKDEYGMTLLEYLAAEDKWNDTDKGAILKDKIDRDCKPSVEPMPALFPAEDSDDDDELIDTPSERYDGYIGDDQVFYWNGKLIYITSSKYGASMNLHPEAIKIIGKYLVQIPDGKWRKFVRPDENTFWQMMIERGACTINNELPQNDNRTKTITPDEMLATLDIVNAAAPYGWRIDYDGKNFPVKFNGKIVTTLDSLALTKVLPPDKFFDWFNPDVSPKEQYINERRKELDNLLDMRKFVEDDPDRLKTLTNLIEDVKREILDAELDTEHPPDFAE